MEFIMKGGLTPRKIEMFEMDLRLSLEKHEVVAVLTEAEASLIKAMREKKDMPSMKEMAEKAGKEITKAIEEFGESIWAGGLLAGKEDK